MENKNLWAPWRSEYVGAAKEEGCFLCRAFAEPENPERLVVRMGGRAFVVMNRFPYSTGHVMVAPVRHTGRLEDLSPEEVSEIFSLALAAKEALAELYRPHGYNLGFNIGKAAGAGLIDHLHLHVVPRWEGDTNFMPVLSEVRVMPHHLEKIRTDLLGLLGNF